ncbi:hypothetical protein L7F22_032030 [Adiantum nelumboides]|nr:hypothetical protein [Adiantum nelumboides]
MNTPTHVRGTKEQRAEFEGVETTERVRLAEGDDAGKQTESSRDFADMAQEEDVDDKIHARSSGPYALVTQQPHKGKSRWGGQRVGEMEVWASEGFGVSYTLQEMLTTKSDHIQARYKVLSAITTGRPVRKPNTVPESFRLLVRELRRMGLNLERNFILEENLIREIENI